MATPPSGSTSTIDNPTTDPESSLEFPSGAADRGTREEPEPSRTSSLLETEAAAAREHPQPSADAVADRLASTSIVESHETAISPAEQPTSPAIEPSVQTPEATLPARDQHEEINFSVSPSSPPVSDTRAGDNSTGSFPSARVVHTRSSSLPFIGAGPAQASEDLGAAALGSAVGITGAYGTHRIEEETGQSSSQPQSSQQASSTDFTLPRMGSYPSTQNPDSRAARVSVGSESQRNAPHTRQRRRSRQDNPEFALPRWQPDAEVTYCPICKSQFSIFVRKHHCRKCGRVVCNSCSPHRIMIPHQYIVRPPGSDIPLPHSLLVDGFGAGYLDVNGMPGGERVRLCNPCVPDPNTAPPQSPRRPPTMSSRGGHQRSRSTIDDAYGPSPQTNRYGGLFEGGSGIDPYRHFSPRTRSVTVASRASGASSSSRYSTDVTYQTPLDRLLSGASSSSFGTSYSSRHGHRTEHGSSSRQRTRHVVPQIAEEDECPICHRELPSQTHENSEMLRESHITSCIEAHSTYASAARRNSAGENAQAVQRRTGMYTYPATEKDCIDDAECTICLEEFAVGAPMARLECLCRFHRPCITAWFVDHPGRCPVHQHDGFGY